MSECRAVRNVVISSGLCSGGGFSEKRLCSGVVEDGARARVIVCRSEENPRGVLGIGMTCPGEGEGGRDGKAGEGGPVDRRDAAVDDGVMGCEGFFFLPENGDRKKDQSDSNCSDSNSDKSGEWSSSAVSRSLSILRSAKRIKNTAQKSI